MASDQHRPVTDASTGKRNAERAGCGDPGRNAVDDFDLHTRRTERRALLATASEHERVAALETHHAATRTRFGDESPLDEALRRRAATAALADVDEARVHAEARKDLAAHEIVVQDYVGLVQDAHRLQRQKLRIAWTRADEKDLARNRSRR